MDQTDPAQVVVPTEAAPPPLEITTSRQFLAWQAEQQLSIALTTYPIGKLFAEASIIDFPLMSHGENNRRFAVVTIQRDIAAVAKIDQPFAEFGFHVLDRATDPQLQRQDLHPCADRLHRALGGVCIPFGEKPVKALHIVQPGGRPD